MRLCPCSSGRNVAALLSLFVGLASTARAAEPQPISPRNEPIRLFNGKDLSGLYTWLQDATTHSPLPTTLTLPDRASRSVVAIARKAGKEGGRTSFCRSNRPPAGR